MTEALQQLFKTCFGDNSILATICISLLPLFELRGGIPFGMSVALWGENALNAFQAMGYAFIGSSLVVPIMAFIFMPLLKLLKKTKAFNKLATTLENKFKKKSSKIETDALERTGATTENKLEQDKIAKKKYFFKCLGVFAFVAVPLPLTGVYTGTCVAVVLGLKLRDVLLSNILGNFMAGLIMTLISSVFAEYTIYVLYVFIGLVVLFLLYGLLRAVISKIKSKKLASASVSPSDEQVQIVTDENEQK